LVDFELSLQEAINAPRFYCHTDALYFEARIPNEVQITLEDKGHPLSKKGAYDLYFGGAHVIQITEMEGGISYLGGDFLPWDRRSQARRSSCRILKKEEEGNNRKKGTTVLLTGKEFL
jgi:hypothetical protein